LSTAAHLSARFTYVSPAGLFPTGQHVVDGGYFENSGDTTAWDILQTIHALNAYDYRIVPIIIEISNSPGESNPGDVAALRRKATDQGNQPAEFDSQSIPLHGFISDALAPVYTMMDTRGARGTYSQMLVRNSGYSVKEFTLAQSAVPLPLGWMLSGGAALEMRDQIGGNDPAKANPKDTALVAEIIRILANP